MCASGSNQNDHAMTFMEHIARTESSEESLIQSLDFNTSRHAFSTGIGLRRVSGRALYR